MYLFLLILLTIKRCTHNRTIRDLNLTAQLTIACSNVNNRNTRKRCEIFLKLTIKSPERRQ